MPGNGKKGTSSIVLCMRKVSVRSVQVLCINEVIATKKVTEKVKKWWKIAILWLFLSHRGCHMAPRPQKHEYLLATMFCTKFEHFRMSGSIICTQLFLSLTRCFKGTSFFDSRLHQRQGSSKGNLRNISPLNLCWSFQTFNGFPLQVLDY